MTMTMPVVGTESPCELEDELVGKFLDHFTIINRLGGGGMGTVYRAMDESLQRFVAVKVLRKYSSGSRCSSETDRVECLL